MINLPQTSTKVSDIQDMIHQKMKEFGIEKIHVSWNEEWIGKLQSLPEGPVRDAEIESGLASFLLMISAHHDGDYEVVTCDDDIESFSSKANDIINSTRL
jgi:hypothetical protein